MTKWNSSPTNHTSPAANIYADTQSKRFHVIQLHIVVKQTWWQGDRDLIAYVSLVKAQKGQTYELLSPAAASGP
jgi:hypothetical protein